MDLLSTAMTLRLTRVDATRGYEVVSEQCVDSGLVSGTWHHIGFNVKDFVHLKKTVVEVSLGQQVDRLLANLKINCGLKLGRHNTKQSLNKILSKQLSSLQWQ